MEEDTKPNYPCTENQLYTVAEMVAAVMSTYLARFTTHSPRFDAPYVINITTKKNLANAIPNSIQRKVGKMTNRVDLIPLGKASITDLNTLKSYLIPAYPTTFAIMYNAAGATLRDEAGNKNWVQTKALFKAMTDFMTVPAQLAQLLLNNVMPPGFPATVAAHELAFKLKHALFLTSKQTGLLRNSKIVANNVLYAILMEIALNAQVIFADEPDILKLFIFEENIKIIAPPGSASLKVALELDEEFTILVGIPVKIQQEGHPSITVPTDIDGIAHFPGINPARYLVTIIGPDLITHIFDKDVDTGTQAHVTVLMEPVPPPPEDEAPAEEGTPVV